jgi:hypothetical protein
MFARIMLIIDDFNIVDVIQDENYSIIIVAFVEKDKVHELIILVSIENDVKVIVVDKNELNGTPIVNVEPEG